MTEAKEILQGKIRGVAGGEEEQEDMYLPKQNLIVCSDVQGGMIEVYAAKLGTASTLLMPIHKRMLQQICQEYNLIDE